MARSRNIKPGFYKNEDLAECSIWARFVFPGLWMLADRDGRLEDRPKRIKGELIPFDAQDMEPLLAELSRRGFIVRYGNEDGKFIQISKFSTHQSPHYSEKKSVIKPPTLRETEGTVTQRNSEKPAGMKEGAQQPDSLIPDLLIPDSPNPLPADADPWKLGKEFLIARGVSKSTVGAYLGMLVSKHGKTAVVEALQAAIVNEPADVKGYMLGALRGKAAKFDAVASNAEWLRNQQ